MSSPILAAALLLLAILFFLLRRTSAASGSLSLPPGSLGWPYFGETFQLYSGGNPNHFFASKQAKYGSIFKTHVLGCRCVMVSSPEAVRYVLVSGADKFRPTFPASKERILGKQAMFFHQGEYHSRLRKLLLRAFSPESIRPFVSDIDSIAEACLASLPGRPTLNTFQEMKTYTFNVALLTILGKGEWSRHNEGLTRCYYALERGYNSMAVNLPGTLFRKAIRARAHLSQILSDIISARRRHQHRGNDLLASLMSADDHALTDHQIADNVIGVLFAARDTTASVLTWVVKFLADNPSVLKDVVEEQEAILLAMSRRLTWDDTKRMPLTSRVLSETLRLASILSFTFREAIEDVQLEGYLIPKGWKVLPLFASLHHSPSNFPNPLNFDPSRFLAAPKPNTYLPFGNGIHSCTGNELARLEILVLVHHLTTKYRWTIVGPQNKIQYGPFALPQDGLLIHLLPKTQEN